MVPSLPQSDSPEQKAARAAQLAQSREEFQYNYTYIAPLPFVDKVPQSHHPSVAWRLKLAKTVVAILRNTLAITKNAARWGGIELHARALAVVEDRQKLQNDILNSIMEGNLTGRARDLADIEKMYMHIKRPPLTDESQTDAFFARTRLAGPNPMVIRRVGAPPPNFPVTDEIFRATMGPEDSLAAAGAERRLYLADYSGLDGLQAGVTEGRQKYLAAPLALFAVPATGSDRSLRPVAIQCGQKPGPANPVLTPLNGVAWQVAKAFVQMADGNYHQAISHLGGVNK